MIDTESKKQRNINEIISKYSFGSVTILIILAISFGLISDGIEMTLMGLFIIPIRKYYDLSKFETQVISSLLFLGVAIGSYLSSYVVSKCKFSKNALHNCYIVLFLSHIGLSFSINMYAFGIFRFLIGLTLGIIIPITLNLFSEYLPFDKRAFFLTSIWIFFSIGQGLQGIVMLIGMPNLEENRMKYVQASLSIFIIIAFILNELYISEGPRHLVIIGETEKAFELLNNLLSNIDGEDSLSQEEKENIINEVKQENKISESYNTNIWSNISELFKEPLLKTTIYELFILLILSFLYYGVLVISTLTMKAFNISHTQSLNPVKILQDQVLAAFISLPSNFIGGIMAEIKFFGRKKSMFIGFIVTGVISFMVMIFQSSYNLLYSFYLFFNLISFNVCLTYTVEVYPTKLRDTSSGFLFGCLRICGFLSQYVYLSLHYIHPLVPYFFGGIISISGAVLSYYLPFETCNQPLDHDYTEQQVELKNSQEIFI